jgi:hypothetical protein
MTTETKQPTEPESAKKSAKATAKPKATAKATKKKAKKPAKKSDRPRVTAEELDKEILKFMKGGKEYSSREVVEGLGRTPGSAQGGPVVRRLAALVEAKSVKNVSSEGKRGQVWMKK